MQVLNNEDRQLCLCSDLESTIQDVVIESGMNTIVDEVWAKIKDRKFIAKRVKRQSLVIVAAPEKPKEEKPEKGKAPKAGKDY